MRGLRLPAWLVYPWLAATLLVIAYACRAHVDAPAPPPPLSAGEGVALAQASPIDPAILVRVRAHRGQNLGTAVSVGDAGVWLTAPGVVERCAQPAVMVGDTEGVPAKAVTGAGGAAAVLMTPRGAPALPLAPAPTPGEIAFAPGFPHGRPGELALRFLGRQTVRLSNRQDRTLSVLAWAERGRTEGLNGALDGLFGGPVLDGEGRIIGVTLDEAPRRGVIFSTTPEALGAALAVAKAPAPTQAAGAVITPDNYGLAADDLRRALRIAPVACMKP